MHVYSLVPRGCGPRGCGLGIRLMLIAGCARDTQPIQTAFLFSHLQEDVFSAIGRPIIESCMRGYNGTIFA